MMSNQSEVGTFTSDQEEVLRSFFDRLRKVLKQKLMTFLNEKVTLRIMDLHRVTENHIPSVFQSDILMYDGEVEQDFEETIHLILPVESAITISGILLMTPQDPLDKQRARNKLTDEARDAADETANQFFGFLGEAIRSEFDQKVSVTRSDCSKIDYASGVRQSLGEGAGYPLIGCSFAIQFAEYEDGSFLLLLPPDFTTALIEEIFAESEIPSFTSSSTGRSIEKQEHSRREGAEEETEELQPKDQTILVLDKKGESREKVVEILKYQGYRVLLADNGWEALGILNDHTVDGLITEIEIERMGGLKLIKEIRADDQLADLPIILCSEVRRKEVIVQAVKELDISHYIAKPFDQEDLLEKVASTLRTS